MFLIRKKLKDFSAAHRLIKNYQGKCTHLHGHNYVTTVLIGAQQLNQFDIVVDFQDIKLICDTWLEENFDHTTLISSEDHALLDFVIVNAQKYYIIPDGKNTSAEVLAEHLFHIFEILLKAQYPELILVEVEVAETINSRAVYTSRI